MFSEHFSFYKSWCYNDNYEEFVVNYEEFVVKLFEFMVVFIYKK